MRALLPKRGKIVTTFMAMLLVITLTASLLPETTATPTLTISIYPVSGTVGTEVEVNGTIDTLDGGYTIRWNGTLNVTTGYATGNNVTTSFVVPQTVGTPSGRDVLIELIDNNKTLDNAVNTTFKLYTNYYVEAIVPSLPSQLQEGQTTEIWVKVTGGEANNVYSANITVTDPSGAVYYNDTFRLTNTTNTGYGEGKIMYPTNFNTGAHTNYTGIYNVAFNKTLASGSFTVGLTNATEYYRFEVVGIEATGYQANESVWVNVTFAGEDVVSIPKNASIEGVVEASWEIPGNASLGVYAVSVTNSSTPGTVKPVRDIQNFTVTTLYHVSADPTRIQEGLHTTITLDVHGAEANTTYTYMINVTDPTSASYNTTITISTNATGSGSNSTLYYKDFPGANTNYVGTYGIAVNTTLATGEFTVGITDRLEYGRTETGTRVYIRGAGYEPYGTVFVNITFAGIPVAGYPELTQAEADGSFIYYWQIPKDAEPGVHTVTLTNGTGVQIKPVHDIQNFTVIEIVVYCKTQNKYDGKSLADVTVEAYRDDVDLMASGKTSEDGTVDLWLDFGNYTFKALWRGEEVGRLENQSIMGNATLPPINCTLASITIAVKDEAGLPLPFIDLTLTSKKTGPLPLPKTGSTGIVATNAFTNISYRIEARRYDHLFFNQSIGNLTSTIDWINITCPTYTMLVHVLDSKGLPLQNAQVEVYEWSSERVMGSITTNDWGSITLSVTFGRYKIKVYDSEYTVVLNETVIDLVQDQSFFVIHCKISNLDLSVVVIDRFGQPIPNALVKLELEFEQGYANIVDLKTQSDGTASLPKIGGNYRISVYVRNKLFGVKTLYLDKSKVIKFKIDKLVVVCGYPLEVTQLITYILLGTVVAVFVLALAYKRFYSRRVQKEEKDL